MPDRTVDTALYDLHCKHEFRELKDGIARIEERFDVWIEKTDAWRHGNGKIGVDTRLDRNDRNWRMLLWFGTPVYIGIVGLLIKGISMVVNHVQGNP